MTLNQLEVIKTILTQLLELFYFSISILKCTHILQRVHCISPYQCWTFPTSANSVANFTVRFTSSSTPNLLELSLILERADQWLTLGGNLDNWSRPGQFDHEGSKFHHFIRVPTNFITLHNGSFRHLQRHEGQALVIYQPSSIPFLVQCSYNSFRDYIFV